MGQLNRRWRRRRCGGGGAGVRATGGGVKARTGGGGGAAWVGGAGTCGSGAPIGEMGWRFGGRRTGVARTHDGRRGRRAVAAAPAASAEPPRFAAARDPRGFAAGGRSTVSRVAPRAWRWACRFDPRGINGPPAFIVPSLHLGDFLHADERLLVLGELINPSRAPLQAVQHVAQFAGGFRSGGDPGHGHDQVFENGQTLLQRRVHNKYGPLKVSSVISWTSHRRRGALARFFDVFARPRIFNR